MANYISSYFILILIYDISRVYTEKVDNFETALNFTNPVYVMKFL